MKRHEALSPFNLYVFDFQEAVGANHFALECHQIFSTAAKMAEVFLLFEYNFITVNIDFNRIGVGYAETVAYFLWNDDSSKLVYFSYNTG